MNNMREKNPYRMLFILTLVVLLVLIVVVVYFFLAKPTINGYIVEKQIEARDITLFAILDQVQQQGYAQITFGNQSLILVPYNPQQKTTP